MLDLLQDLLTPVTRRMGTLASGVFTGAGVATDDVTTLQSAATILVGLVFDLILSKRARDKEKRDVNGKNFK